jgi:hypothetical protein
MTRARPFDEQLARISETRKRPDLSLLNGKGRPPPRERPADFEIVFVEIGRIDCEVYYRAARITIDRWLDEVGKARLIELRAQFVAHQRKSLGPLRGGIREQTKKMLKAPRPPRATSASARDRRKVSQCIARQAAHYLRARRNGGWIVSPAGDSEWWIGTKRISAAQLLDMAIDRDFNLKDASKVCEIADTGGQS